MGRPRLFEEGDGETVKVALSQAMLLQLKAISLASRNGQLRRPDMLRRAIEEYIAARISDPDVQASLRQLSTGPQLVRANVFIGTDEAANS